jgi:undecaprenyl-diphosphatase
MGKFKNYIKFSLNSKTALNLSLEIILGITICLSSLYLFLKIGHEVLEKEILNFDILVTNFIYGFRSSQVTDVMLMITFLGSGLVLLVVSGFFIFYVSRYRKKDALIFSTILYSAIILNLLLKLFYQRPRPDNFPLIHENTLSFPSGHAMNSFVFFAAVSYFIFRETKNIKLAILISFISLIIVILIGFSRVYLGAHYPSDVLAGWIAGFFWFISAIIFEKIIITRRLYSSSKK